MIIIKTKQEIEKMQIAADLLVKVHRALRDEVKPGVTTLELDRFVEKFITDRGGYPEQKGYQGFPYSICASVNDEICHGFPTDRKLKDGDLLTIDMVVNVDGYLADSAWSYAVGNISDEAKKLMDVTKECLYRSIALVKPGVRLGDIGHAIQTYAEANGFSVVRDFVGHGIGTNMHEDPQVLHYGKPGRGIRLEEGMVFTIEPMINAGDWPIKMDDNGWTARTRDGSLSCQYEHTLAVTADGVIVLTEQGE
ncbi:type I methionyl aminopeptidase [Aedoeadaptatus coxii]|uniref:type I methionyl aminopeptidase n=1 Tax=Aedoeadaptatus coxii TaxID=755172 RepID=UPI002AD481B5|nr:type I methionyl aminopeptidase [Peptoniphilus coxii]